MKEMVLSLICVLISLSVTNVGASEINNWAFGVHYGSLQNFKGSYGLDLQLPSFYKNEHTNVGLGFDLDFRTLNSSDIDPVYSLSLSLLFRNNLYKELVSSYMRVGLGYSVVDERLHEDEGFIFIPFVFGADLLTYNRDARSGAIFVETGFHLDFIDEDEHLDIYNGTFVNIGVRSFF